MAHLVFQTAFPGDLFLSIPLMKNIKRWEPKSPLALACRPGLGDFFKKINLVDEVIEIDKRSREGRSKALRRLQESSEWEVVFVPHESVRTGLWMSRVRAKRGKVGFRKWWNLGIYGQRVVKPTILPEALRQLSLLSTLVPELARQLSSSETSALRSPDSQVSPFGLHFPKIPEWASMRMLSHAPLDRRIFLAPGSVWATKRWTQSGYTELAKLLLRRDFQVELVGSPAEKDLCDQIAREVTGVVNLAGQTSLSELVERFSRGMALICNDSGAMHAAAVVELPTVAIFGPTVLAQGFRPWQNRAVVVQRELDCRPCGRHGAKKCPLGTHECMKSITPTEVIVALDQVLAPP